MMSDVTGPAAEIAFGCPEVAGAALRIAHVLDAPVAQRDANGVSEAVRCLASAQAASGLAVGIFSAVDGAHVAGGAAAVECRTAARARPAWSVRDLLVSRYLSDAFAKGVLAWQPDLLHFHSVHVPRNVAIAIHARRTGIPYCVTVHGALFPDALRRGRVKKLIFNLLVEDRFLRDAAFVHALSPQEVEVIRAYGFGGPIVVAPNGVPPGSGASRQPRRAPPNPVPGRNRPVFMFLGRLDTWHKGLDVLIEGFARAALADGTLVLVGPDCRGSRRVLEARAERLGVLGRVVFTGAAFGESRDALLANADVFVHPSRWEGMSLSVLAAAASGKPCLLTRAADPLGSLERAGAAVTVEPTADGVAAGLRTLAGLSRSALHAMGDRAKQVADAHVGWTEAAGCLIGAYRNAVSASARPRVLSTPERERRPGISGAS